MSIPVELSALAEKMEQYGPVAYLITTGDDGAPHVVSTTPAWDGERLALSAGSRTLANATARPAVTLLWPAAPGGEYSLIVDGVAEAGEGGVAVTPTRAVAHRLPSADPSLPSCVPVLDRAGARGADLG